MALHLCDLSDDFILRVAGDYLCAFATMEKLAKKYKTSPATISNILYKAVSQNIADDITAEAIAQKAMISTENIVRTRRRWEKALELRTLPSVKAAIEYNENKLAELQFQYDTYDEYYAEETDAPTKRSIWCSIGRVQGEINRLKELIKA